MLVYARLDRFDDEAEGVEHAWYAIVRLYIQVNVATVKWILNNVERKKRGEKKT